jgi:hypothetical protein
VGGITQVRYAKAADGTDPTMEPYLTKVAKYGHVLYCVCLLLFRCVVVATSGGLV